MKHFPWASALLFGIVVGVLIAQLPGIQIQRSIDLDGLVSLLVGLILFFGLNLLYPQQSTVVRGEKEILMKLLHDALAFERCYREDPLSPSSVEEILADLQRV